MPRRRKSNKLNAKKEKALNSVAKFMDDEAEEDEPELKEKQTTFSMATPAVSPDSKLQHSKMSKVPRAKKAARFEPHIRAAPDFGHHPRWGESAEELNASINFKTPNGQDACGNILYPRENNNNKMPVKEDNMVAEMISRMTPSIRSNFNQVDQEASKEDNMVAEMISRMTPSIRSNFDQVDQEASKPSSVLPTKRPMESIDDKDARLHV
jgi:hypothetical protein